MWYDVVGLKSWCTLPPCRGSRRKSGCANTLFWACPTFGLRSTKCDNLRIATSFWHSTNYTSNMRQDHRFGSSSPDPQPSKIIQRCIWRPTWTPRAWPTAPPPSRCSAWRSPAGGPCWRGAAQRPGSEVPKKEGFTQETKGFQWEVAIEPIRIWITHAKTWGLKMEIWKLGIWVTKQEDVTAEKESNKANKYLTATCGFNQAKMKKHKKTIHHIYPPNIGILQKGMEDEGWLITKNQISLISPTKKGIMTWWTQQRTLIEDFLQFHVVPIKW